MQARLQAAGQGQDEAQRSTTILGIWLEQTPKSPSKKGVSS